MFGFVTANIADLSDVEKQRYQSLYCGLCHTLKERHGQRARACLSYDSTFLAMVLGSLYEPAEQSREERCVVHPLEHRTVVSQRFIDYAADMTIALAYHKCLDDWQDDHKLVARHYNKLLEAPYRRVSGLWPDQCATLERELAAIQDIERTLTEAASRMPQAKEHLDSMSARTRADEAAECDLAFGDVESCAEITQLDAVAAEALDTASKHFGIALASAFTVDANDHWAEALGTLGARIGRFIYVMDAACDLEEDRAHDAYNPFRFLTMGESDRKTLLMHLAGDAVSAFEALPLEQDLHLMRSVLYAGVWQKYCKTYETTNMPAEGTR